MIRSLHTSGSSECVRQTKTASRQILPGSFLFEDGSKALKELGMTRNVLNTAYKM